MSSVVNGRLKHLQPLYLPTCAVRNRFVAFLTRRTIFDFSREFTEISRDIITLWYPPIKIVYDLNFYDHFHFVCVVATVEPGLLVNGIPISVIGIPIPLLIFEIVSLSQCCWNY